MIGAITAGLFGIGVPPVTNSYESIATVTVGSGGSSTISFTSIPSTYKHLQIRAIGRSAAAVDYNVDIKFNSDTGANYAFHRLFGTGAAVAASGAGSLSYATIGTFLPLSTETANSFGVAVIDVLDYADVNKFKTVRSLNGRDVNGGGTLGLWSCLWRSTSAVTRIDFAGSSGNNFAQYTQFALYGIKG